MRPSRTTQVLFGVMILLTIILVIVWRQQQHPQKPEPNAPGYYTGPLQAKGNPNSVGTEDGEKVTLPPDSLKPPASKPSGGAPATAPP